MVMKELSAGSIEKKLLYSAAEITWDQIVWLVFVQHSVLHWQSGKALR